MDYTRLIEQAKQIGFTDSGELNIAKLEFLQEVRDMCASDKCHNFGRSWSCPPAAPTLEEMRAIVEKYKNGLLVQTVGQMEDSLDYEEMMASAQRHSSNVREMWKFLREEYPDVYAMGAGGCQKCPQCAYPDAPCRFPDELMYSMEACGLVVSRVATDSGMKYNHGKDTICYTSCFLLD